MRTILTLHDPTLAQKYYAEGLWRHETFYSLLLQHTQKNPDHYAVRDSSHRLTYQELLSWVNTLAEDLHQAGVREGQRVSIWLPNGIEAVVILLACSRNGYVCNTSLHRNYTVAEIIKLITRIRSAALFAKPGYGADADKNDIFQAVKDLSFLKKIYRVADIEQLHSKEKVIILLLYLHDN
jgi:acyl-CoA synthetase